MRPRSVAPNEIPVCALGDCGGESHEETSGSERKVEVEEKSQDPQFARGGGKETTVLLLRVLDTRLLPHR